MTMALTPDVISSYDNGYNARSYDRQYMCRELEVCIVVMLTSLTRQTPI